MMKSRKSSGRVSSSLTALMASSRKSPTDWILSGDGFMGSAGVLSAIVSNACRCAASSVSSRRGFMSKLTRAPFPCALAYDAHSFSQIPGMTLLAVSSRLTFMLSRSLRHVSVSCICPNALEMLSSNPSSRSSQLKNWSMYSAGLSIDSSFLRSFVMWLGSSFSSLRRGKEPFLIIRPMEVCRGYAYSGLA